MVIGKEEELRRLTGVDVDFGREKGD